MLTEMRQNITQRLRDFWDAGIRGPDFVWAATGRPWKPLASTRRCGGQRHRRDYDRLGGSCARCADGGRLCSGPGAVQDGKAEVTGLDDLTTYYLLRRNDFGLEDTRWAACILYALSCNLSDSAPGEPARPAGAVKERRGPRRPGGRRRRGRRERRRQRERRRGKGEAQALAPPPGRSLGLEGPGVRPAPLIDRPHKLMRLWRAGDQARVNEYLDHRGLQRPRLLQALIEPAPAGSEERAAPGR